MIEVQKQYKLTLTEDQARQLYDLLRTEKDCGGLGIDGRLSDLRALGWTDWYHPNYWVHPDLSDNLGKIDYTYLGMSLEQAIIYENSGKRK